MLDFDFFPFHTCFVGRPQHLHICPHPLVGHIWDWNIGNWKASLSAALHRGGLVWQRRVGDEHKARGGARAPVFPRMWLNYGAASCGAGKYPRSCFDDSEAGLWQVLRSWLNGCNSIGYNLLLQGNFKHFCSPCDDFASAKLILVLGLPLRCTLQQWRKHCLGVLCP